MCRKDFKAAKAKINTTQSERPTSNQSCFFIKQLPAHHCCLYHDLHQFLSYFPILSNKAFCNKDGVVQVITFSMWHAFCVAVLSGMVLPSFKWACSRWHPRSHWHFVDKSEVTDTEIASQLAGSGIIFIGRTQSAAVSILHAASGKNEGFVGEQVELADQKLVKAQAKATAQTCRHLAVKIKKAA
jgi:seryl-tRNA synthetase